MAVSITASEEMAELLRELENDLDRVQQAAGERVQAEANELASAMKRHTEACAKQLYILESRHAGPKEGASAEAAGGIALKARLGF